MIALALTTTLFFQGTRACSDGTRPHDRLGERPLTFTFERSGRLTVAITTDGVHDGGQACTTIQRGTYHFEDETLRTTIESIENCGDCPPPPPIDRQESAARFTPFKDKLRFHFDQSFGERGSCRPGQSLELDLKPMHAETPPACETTPSS